LLDVNYQVCADIFTGVCGTVLIEYIVRPFRRIPCTCICPFFGAAAQVESASVHLTRPFLHQLSLSSKYIINTTRHNINIRPYQHRGTWSLTSRDIRHQDCHPPNLPAGQPANLPLALLLSWTRPWLHAACLAPSAFLTAMSVMASSATRLRP
jgi:hypothetical protein